MNVPCPVCHAAAGEPCSRYDPISGLTLPNPHYHLDREKAAAAAPEQLPLWIGLAPL